MRGGTRGIVFVSFYKLFLRSCARLIDYLID